MEKPQRKKRILSGIQPTGIFTLGNYLGAIRNWKQMQEDYNCIFFIADMHAVTIRQDPASFKKQTLECFALLLACGIDPEKSIVFIQSHVPSHSQLTWLLNCNTQFGELSRMTQFKDKSSRHSDNINAGLFSYPVLMAADILIYSPDLVPVGNDQKQHIELTRDIVNRFNNAYGKTFTMPDAYIPKLTARVMSLSDPTKKMSKSADDNLCIDILDTPAQIIKKFRRAVTDSDSLVAYREGKDGINNLMSIYSSITGKSFEEIESEFDGRGYGDFKTAVGEAVAEELAPIRENYDRLMNDRSYLKAVYADGAKKAATISSRVLEKAYKRMGFIPPEK
ncbi:MAG: tryptophan--tRNA ligase [Clostridiales bacterium]|nr:tryptophan--tRNA ligase [Clostridiales bacterium]